MANANRACNLDDSALSCVLDECLRHFPDIRELRKEQKTCLLNLARGKDVFAIMPTGFGKSLIFQLFPRLAKAALSLENSTIIVVSPLISIMRDQVEQLQKLGFSAAAIGIGEEGEEDEKRAREGKCEIVFGSPESWLSKTWQKELQYGKLGKQTSALALDEVHSVTEWGFSEGSKKKKQQNPFREAFGRIKDMRSFLPGIPLLALTASVQVNERSKLIKACGMIQPVIVDVSPNKENITFNFMAVLKEKEAVSHLRWIAEMVIKSGKDTPQTIVFCNTFNDISAVLSYLLLVLKENAFIEDDSGKRTCLLGIYHAKSWESQKVCIEEDFKKDGIKRIVIATCALGMGINFPRVRYVVQYGPPKNIVDLMQQAGRGGRDGSRAHCVTYYTKRQLSRCGNEVKSVIQAEGCQRQALYGHFTDLVSSLTPGHLCCSNCIKLCACCLDGTCCGDSALFMTTGDSEEETTTATAKSRILTPEDQNDLRLALLELRSKLSAYGTSFFEPTASHGFSEQVVEDIVENASTIFTLDNLQENFSIYCTQHVMDVLEVFQELFEDIPDFYQQMEVLSTLSKEVARAEDYLQAMEIAACVESAENLSDDSDEFDFLLPEFDLQF